MVLSVGRLNGSQGNQHICNSARQHTVKALSGRLLQNQSDKTV